MAVFIRGTCALMDALARTLFSAHTDAGVGDIAGENQLSTPGVLGASVQLWLDSRAKQSLLLSVWSGCSILPLSSETL